MTTDVIVIGSGPAGCAAAISCKLRGLKVLLIAGKSTIVSSRDIADEPSESIHPAVVSMLDQLNAPDCIRAATRGTYEGITVNGELKPLGGDEQGNWQGHHINRKLFDQAFLQAAKEQGITFLNEEANKIVVSNDRVSGVITNSGAVYHCRFLVDASGNKRIAGKQLGFQERFSSAPLAVWTGTANDIPANNALFENSSTKFDTNGNGWTWIAPEIPNRCTWTRLELKGRQQFLPPPELAAYSDLSKIKKNNRRWRVFRPVCKEGVLLCGDAAGIIDPAAGQGILHAILSATMAVTTIKKCITAPDFEAMFLSKYDNWFMTSYIEKVQQLRQYYAALGINIF